MAKKVFILFILVIAGYYLRAQQQIQAVPQFPGGIPGLISYIEDHIEVPPDALRDSVSGEVYLKFVVRTDGSVDPDRVTILTSLSPSCDDEAKRVIRASPAWTPARDQANNPIELEICFPVVFPKP